ncbi:phage protein Gp36 family protein [Avibacterium paragallinarum]|nr:phage protein Gp36 family protein [Avibacterium paragallinarum]
MFLPLHQVPTLVRNLCLQLARYWLYSRRPDGKGFPDQVKRQLCPSAERFGAYPIRQIAFRADRACRYDDDNVPAVPRFVARAPEKVDLSGY